MPELATARTSAAYRSQRDAHALEELIDVLMAERVRIHVEAVRHLLEGVRDRRLPIEERAASIVAVYRASLDAAGFLRPSL